MTGAPITTPLAQNQTSTATVCSPWFVDFTDENRPVEFHPLPCSYKPLVNGEEAFSAVYDAINAARFSVDIICWGFQPSMYFKRGDRGASMNIGDLLITKGLQGVRVRVLCWADSLGIAQMCENSTPGLTWWRHFFTQNENNAEREYDREWYRHATAPGIGPQWEDARNKWAAELRARHTAGLPPPDPAQVVALQGFPCVELATRDFSLKDRWEIMWRESRFRDDKNLNEEAVTVGFGGEPSHHQKMVMVDYDAPEHAVGFVMGHNTLDAYWDDDKHSFARMHPRFGRNGATPRQDMSACVTGPILEHLNVNFCRAWQHTTKVDLITPRKALASRLTVRQDKGTPVMAQILRTQSQKAENRRDIRSMYKQVTNNTSRFMYIENQYFRWPPLVDQIKAAVNKQLAWGRDTGRDGTLYLFVVTNSSDDALENGQVSTYRMMESLGHADTMPDITKAERDDALQQQKSSLQSQIDDIDGSEQTVRVYGTGTATQNAPFFARSEARKKDLQQQLDAVNGKISANKSGPVVPSDITGLKTLICTLVAPDSPAGNWMNTYVHSKIMVIDDVFLTHGSANINTRSMEVDSELNICHEHGDVTNALRKRLWTIHTRNGSVSYQGGQSDSDANNAQAIGDNIEEAFKAWSGIITSNKKRMDSKKQSPLASLIAFRTDTTKRSKLD
ncbi:phospholipase D-like domain-containing protein [Paraburkholderia fungorum]|uniref:Phosphatidylserine/phosphatidylglycerophosphate/ cardiolipin synthase-like enzyme n=1 Tax=Paraburkholderia fungorum TaxID=134537 RepID=A0AAW3V8M1_9BURK|nr:phospholipase D-like domain-containing protein [Paraburkholderia fungorum]MBB4519435.1 phosphatidylserine/phosphatidylglycerophosphate/cardiolipin synthase-like enzyme [Paraburkholderia fungorum]MBB6207268.1 phosphatidylserine/phosphatidylglycerophosphate/cardiolipin synthase-like enzyme [Paraburkholderia fungorum]